jgi:hypothetical protein
MEERVDKNLTWIGIDPRNSTTNNFHALVSPRGTFFFSLLSYFEK